MPKKIITDNAEAELKKLLSDPKMMKKALELLKKDEQSDFTTPERSTKKPRGRPRKIVTNEDEEETQEKVARRPVNRRFDPSSLHNEFDPKKYENQCKDREDRVLKEQNVVVNNNRPPAKLVKAICSACHKTYKVPQGYVTSTHGYYRCDRCTGN
jgi:hypothetical protein